LVFAALLADAFIPHSNFELSEKELFSAALNYHPYQRTIDPEVIKAMPKEDRPDLAWEQDFMATMDPQLGRPAPERLEAAREMVRNYQQKESTPGSLLTPWVERGPANVGGRTRALMYDPNDITGKKVWAGGVSGGLWYNTDISNSNSAWVPVNDFWNNIAISAIAYDPTNTQVMYVGTGEGWGAGSGRGAGIWKSTDGGQSWNHLSATANFFYVHDLAVRDENGNGVLYVALRNQYYGGQWHGGATQGLQRSTDGGQSFTQVLPNVPSTSNAYAAGDLEISANNTLWVATRDNSSNDGGGTILKSTDGTSFTTAYASANADRVELACAPSDSNYLYALLEVGGTVGGIIQSTDGGQSWSNRNEPNDVDNGIPASDFSRGQAWYDLIAAVDPNDEKTLIVGAINLFRSTDGGNTWDQISKWSNNNALGSLPVSYVHADQHAIVYKDGSSSEVLFGTDGGVFYTTNVAAASSSNVIADRNKDYSTTQFYATAIHPNQDYYLAGSQDNGTQKLTLPGKANSVRATGGDGGFCFIDQDNPNYQLTSYVYNNFWRSTDGGNSFGWGFIFSDNSGRFINPADYDDRQNAMYSAKTATSIYRLDNVTGANPLPTTLHISGMTNMASHFRVSPHTLSSTTLFIGCDNGDVFKVTDADSNPVTTKISGNLPAGNISCVEIGSSESELLVTLSNYGLTSVWYTNDGGATWVSKEGNLPDMPVRWALFNPNDRNEVILATEVGIWSTTNFNNSSPNWTPSNNGLSNVRVNMLQIREVDDRVVAATFGRGLFTSDGFKSNVLAADFNVNKIEPCVNDVVTFTDASNGSPSNYSWTFTPNTVNFVSGTSASSQNPQVSFNASGSYDVQLVVSDGTDTDTLVKPAFINVTQSQPITFNIARPMSPFCKNQTVPLQASPAGGTWSGNGVIGSQFLTTLAGDGSHTVYYQVEFGSSCTVIDSVELQVDIVPQPTITQNGSTLTCNQSGFNYTWIYNGAPIGGNTQSIQIQGNGNYVVRIGKGSSVCSEDSPLFSVNNFSQDELKKAIGLKVYPNPVSSFINVELATEETKVLNVQVLDNSGKLVKSEEITAGNSRTSTVNVESLSSGVYFLKLKNEDFTIEEKFIKN